MTTAAPPRSPLPGRSAGSRTPLARPLAGRHLGGVCVGIAEHLGLPARPVRLIAILLVLAGVGAPAYFFLWAVVPESRPGATIDPASGAPSAPVQRALAGVARSRHGALLAIGGLLMALGGLVALQSLGLNVRAGLLAPLLIVGVGAVVVWSDLDKVNRDAALRGTDEGRGWVWLRLGLGTTLVVIGILVVTVRGTSLTAALDAVVATLVVLVGLILIAAPWVLRLWSTLRTQQEESVRARERADIAAHLHDSVLQTLALIQRQADDGPSVRQLARGQERELRAYLYGGSAAADDTLAAAVASVAHQVEDVSGVPVEVVVTGDRPMGPHGQALVKALREALLNATRHGRPPVTAYVEIGATGVEAFVRDRGDGFDLEAVPADRLGVRGSIIARMERHGGQATITRRDDGTEISLRLPLPEGQ